MNKKERVLWERDKSTDMRIKLSEFDSKNKEPNQITTERDQQTALYTLYLNPLIQKVFYPQRIARACKNGN